MYVQCTELNWKGFVSEQAVTWQQTMVNWLVDNSNHSVMVVKYEELKLHTEGELGRILDFLGAPYSTAKLAEVTWKEERELESERSDAFEGEQLEYIDSVIRKTASTLSGHAHTRDIHISSYCYYKV